MQIEIESHSPLKAHLPWLHRHKYRLNVYESSIRWGRRFDWNSLLQSLGISKCLIQRLVSAPLAKDSARGPGMLSKGVLTKDLEISQKANKVGKPQSKVIITWSSDIGLRAYRSLVLRGFITSSIWFLFQFAHDANGLWFGWIEGIIAGLQSSTVNSVLERV